MPAKHRQPLLAFVFGVHHPTSHVASALVFILAVLILYHAVKSVRKSHSRLPIGTCRRFPLTRLLAGKEDAAAADLEETKPRMTSPDGLVSSITSPAPPDISVYNDDKYYYHYPSSYSPDPNPNPTFNQNVINNNNNNNNMARKQNNDKDNAKPGHNPLRPKAPRLTAHTGPSATITLPQGRYTGILLSPGPTFLPRAVEAWRGIPYAQTTAGANRFRPPVPLVGPGPGMDRRGTPPSFVADRFGPICPGTAARVPGMVDGEDCLNLNVYRPAGPLPGVGGGGAGLMPVVIYVHGGAFNGGLGAERDMASFVGWSETPIMGVNFNYRVGALGFPSSGVAEGEGVLNLGLKDQRMLFEWVRENIAQFGGDRDRVTLMGLSAGAHSVS